MSLKKINHVGIVVEDIEEARERYSKLYGIRKWYSLCCTDFSLWYHGEKRDCEVTLYFGGRGTTKIELIGTRGEDNIYTEFFRRRGEGIHHIMYNTKDLDASIREFGAHGYEVLQNATFRSGSASVRYAYLGRSEDTIVTELIETTVFGKMKKGDMACEYLLGTLTGSYKRLR